MTPPAPKPRYRFVERLASTGGDLYVWETPVPGDSRVEQMAAGVDWFWNSVRPDHLPPLAAPGELPPPRSRP